jgi:glycosyltransferase involved in cell wall biosynthesis
MRTDPAGSQSPCAYRILMTADAVGGVWNYSIDLASELCGRGAEVFLATFGPPPNEEQRATAGRIQNLKLVESQFSLEWTPGVTGQELRQSGEWLLAQAEAFRPHLVQINGYFHGALPWKAPIVVVAHSCVYSWWLSTHGTLPPDSWLAYRERVSRGMAAANAMVAPSRFMFNALNQIYSLNKQPEHIIHNFSNLIPILAVKEDIIFASGRCWDPAKNILLLSKIAPKLPWPVYLAGPTVGPNGERQICSELVCLGELSRMQMTDLLSRASIFVHPAKYEPFGLSVLEAAINSCALVLSEIPSLRELWGDCALYAAPNDENQWVGHILQLAGDRGFRQELGRRAAARAKMYSPGGAVSSYVNLYDSLVHGANI